MKTLQKKGIVYLKATDNKWKKFLTKNYIRQSIKQIEKLLSILKKKPKVT